MPGKRLDRLLRAALERKLIGADTAEALGKLDDELDRDRGGLTLSGTLSRLGGTALGVGILLVFAANWDGIPDAAKLGGLFLLLVGAHAGGFRLRGSYPRTAEALHFIGGALFIGGVGLIAQIYHLDGHPPAGVLFWFCAIAPLVALLRLRTLVLQALFAGVLWLHMESASRGSPFHMGDSFSAHLFLELGLSVGLVGFAALLRQREPAISSAFRWTGIVMGIVPLYILGFYRHYARWSWMDEAASPLAPLLVLAFASLGLVLGARHLAPGQPWMRNRLVALLAALLALGTATVVIDFGWIGPGAQLQTEEFGWTRTWTLGGWIVSVAAWLLWFLLGLWMVAAGARAGLRSYVNLGVSAVGVGIVTRFFDLMGSQMDTGLIFITGGVLLLGTGFAMDRWRRRLMKGMEARP